MKFLTLIQDNRAVIHLDFTRAPDLLRREYSDRYGSAQILYCCVSPAELGSDEITAAFAKYFADRRQHGGYNINPR